MRLLIVDDHPVFRQGFAALVEQAWPDAVVSQAKDAATAIAVLSATDGLDIVVLDLVLPDQGGLSVLEQIGRSRPDLPVLVLTSSEDEADIRAAMARGASGYVPKSASAGTLLSALRLVLGGDLYVPPLMLRAASAPGRALTARQADVLRLAAEGHSNKAIARALGLSEKTVKAHLASIFKLLGVAGRVQAIAAARSAALI